MKTPDLQIAADDRPLFRPAKPPMRWGFPLLLGALIASGAGGWLATRGFVVGGGAALVVAAVLAIRAWLRVR